MWDIRLTDKRLCKRSVPLVLLILLVLLDTSCIAEKVAATPSDDPSSIHRQMTSTASIPQTLRTTVAPPQPAPTTTVAQITQTQQTSLVPIPSPFAPPPTKSLILARVAEDDHYDLFVLSADGSYLMKITDSPENDFAPAWSPDLQQIAFISTGLGEWINSYTYRPGQDSLYMVNVDGTGLTNITLRMGVRPAEGSRLQWSFDGHDLAFLGEADTDRAIFIVNAEGTQLRRISVQLPVGSFLYWSLDDQQIYYETTTSTGSALIAVDLSDSDSQNIMANTAHALGYFLSPDQRKIAASIWGVEWVVGIADVEDGEWILIPNPDQASGQAFIYDVSWSPDSSSLAFVVQYVNQRSALYAVNADGTDLRLVDDIPTFDYSPPLYWLQGSQQLAYLNLTCQSSTTNCEWAIHIADVNSGQTTILDDQLNGDFTPVLSPDGERFLLIGQGEGEEGLYIMQADGSGLKRILEREVENASWAPIQFANQ